MTELIEHDEISAAGGAVEVFAANHPLRAGREHVSVPTGTTLREIVDRVSVVPEIETYALVYVGDHYVPSHLWPYTRPHEGATVTIRVVPQGGGGDKNPVRTILTIAVVAFAAYVSAGGLAGGTASLWTRAAGAAIGIAGRMLIDEIAPLPTAEEDSGTESDPRKFAVEDARNRPLRYEPIPRAFGEIRWVPPYSVTPYTEVEDNNQYLRFAVCWGYGPLDIRDVKIGETRIEDFEEVEVSHDFGDGNGWTNGDLVSRTVDEQSLSILLAESDSNPWHLRTTGDNVDEISVDVTFPGGLVEINDDGSKKEVAVKIEVQYAKEGTNDWNIPEGSSISFGARSIGVPAPRDSGYHDQTQYVGVNIYIDRYLGGLGYQYGTASTLQSTATIPDAPKGKVALATVMIDSNNQIVEPISNTNRPSDIFGSMSDFQVSDGGVDSSVGFYGSSGRSFDVSSGELVNVGLTTKAATTSTLRRSLSWKVDEDDSYDGKYDVRIRRVTADRSSNQIQDEVHWTKLRGITHESPVDQGFADDNNIAQTAVRIKATDQLNGIVDQLNAVTHSILPDWDGSNWVSRMTDNNASIAREILQGKANPEAMPDSRLDLTSFQDMHTRVDSKGWSFGGVINGGSVREALKDVLSIVRASWSVVDGTWELVSDEERTTPVQHLTPKNSRDFSATKRFTRKPHALRVKFKNEEQGYQRDERIVYDDGYSEDGSESGTVAATIFEDLEATGITKSDHAYSYGRYVMASNRLRPEVYSITVDFEHLVATPGDLVLVQHDVPLFGIASGRVKSVDTDSSGDITGVTVDEELTLEGGKTYAMRFRKQDGDTVVRTLSFSDSADKVTSTVSFTSTISGSDPVRDGDLFMFGEETSETVEAIVQSIEEGNSRWDATLNLVDHAQPAIENAVDTIPAYDSQITEPQPFIQFVPAQPTLDEIISDETVLVREDDGTFGVRIMVSFEVPSTNRVEAAYVQARWRNSNDNTGWEFKSVPEPQGFILLDNVNQGDDYRIQLRSLTDDGRAGDWNEVTASHTVVGKSNPPSDVTGLTASTTNWVDSGSKSYGIHLSWDDVPDRDLDRYEVRTNTSFGTTSSAQLARPKDNQIDLPITTTGSYTFYVKAVDTNGNYSTNAASVSISISSPDAPTSVSATTTNKLDGNANSYGIRLTWTNNETDFPIAKNRVYDGAGNQLDEVGGAEATLPITTSGSYTLEVESEDVAGNVSSRGSTSITISAPDAPTSIAATTTNELDSSSNKYGIRITWTNNATDFPVARSRVYNVTGTKNDLVAEVSGTEANLPITTAGDYDFEVETEDVAGNVSGRGTTTSPTISISVPNAPSSVSATTTNKLDGNANSYGIRLTWTNNDTDFPVTKSRVYDGAGNQLDEVGGTESTLPITTAASYTLEVESEDVAGNVSSRGSTSITISAPDAPTSVTATTTNKLDGNSKSYGIRVEWTNNETDFPIAKNRVYDSSNNLLEEVSGTRSTLPITTAASYTFDVEPVDVAGNAGSRGSVSITINAPGQPTLSQRFKADDFLLSWTEDVTDFPIAYYDVRRQYGSETGNLTIEGSTNTIKADQSAANPVDLSDFDNAHTTQIVTSGFSDATNNGTFDIDSVSIGNDVHEITVSQSLADESAEATVDHVNTFAQAERIDTLQSREFKFIADWLGTRTWYVADIDVAGNQGTAGSVDATISAPPKPSDLRSKVINFDVLLNWDAVKGTLPVDHYNVYRNDDENASQSDSDTELSTTVNGTFASIKEDTEGTFAYFVTAEDTAGNEGPVASLTAFAEEPNDFVVQSNFTSDFTSGTRTNLVLVEPGANALLGPFDTSETWDDHFVGTGTQSNPQFETPQEQIDAGFPYYLQPGRKDSGTYQEEFDAGVVLNTTTITVSYGFTQVRGSPTTATQIEVRETTNDPWRVFEGKTILANDVRYIRVTITVDGPQTDDLGKMTNLAVKAKVKKVTDEGVVTANSGDSDSPLGGTKVTLGTTFLDIRGGGVTVKGDKPGYTAFWDYEDVQGQDEIHVWVYDSNGNRATQDISYVVRGLVK